MIALDTNVLVRYLVRDDVAQAEAARALIDGLTPAAPAFICREVIVETAWMLERSYRFARSQIAETMIELATSDTLVVENSEDVAAAAYRYRQGGAGFSDWMILAAVTRAVATPLHTFDRKLAEAQDARLVEVPAGA